MRARGYKAELSHLDSSVSPGFLEKLLANNAEKMPLNLAELSASDKERGSGLTIDISMDTFRRSLLPSEGKGIILITFTSPEPKISCSWSTASPTEATSALASFSSESRVHAPVLLPRNARTARTTYGTWHGFDFALAPVWHGRVKHCRGGGRCFLRSVDPN